MTCLPCHLAHTIQITSSLSTTLFDSTPLTCGIFLSTALKRSTGTMSAFGDSVWLLVVAALWGGTNPFIKKGGQGIENIHKDNKIAQFLAELKFLVLNWRYLLPFLLNQSGSVIFYLTLASADLSLAVPITNSLTFIMTGLSGKLLGEQFGNKEVYLGILFVMFGISLCVLSKVGES